MGLAVWLQKPPIVETLKIHRQDAARSDAAERSGGEHRQLKQSLILPWRLVKVPNRLMERGEKDLVRHRIDGLNLESAIGPVKPSARMINTQGGVDKRLSSDPSGKVCLHWGDHHPKMLLAKLVQKAEVAHNDERRYGMNSLVYPNRSLLPVEIHAIV
jgi:hypothetical protein